MGGHSRSGLEAAEPVAGNGLLHRRALFTGVAAGATGFVINEAAATPLAIEEWMRVPGSPFNRYGLPSKYEGAVERTLSGIPGTAVVASSRSPLHLLEGAITPNGLHFERHHSEIPDIDPDRSSTIARLTGGRSCSVVARGAAIVASTNRTLWEV